MAATEFCKDCKARHAVIVLSDSVRPSLLTSPNRSSAKNNKENRQFILRFNCVENTFLNFCIARFNVCEEYLICFIFKVVKFICRFFTVYFYLPVVWPLVNEDIHK